ncbi:MAG: FAD-binding protein [Proteobacteria bacterium]|nr:FAD-binding protein [Pseudomonadota bacterium]MDA1057646.1 FAD-binding protein [Pseudomonadota bacterium]
MHDAPARTTRPQDFAPAFEEVSALLGDRFTTAASVRAHHGRDESYHPNRDPDAVAFVRSTEEVSQVVQICARHKVPIVPFGAGTSLEGHVVAIQGGLSIDMMQMNSVLEVNAEDLDCTVQAGVTRKQLNAHLRDTGLFFPIDPGADASLGGMSATRASGTNAVRYGTMRENVMGLTVVMPDGRIVKTARRARKSSAGYDLTRLFVGSEGTLGVITEVAVRLYGIPEAISAASCYFDSVQGAVDAVIQTIQLGIPVARIEFADEVQIDATNRHFDMDHAVKPTLWLEFHGTPAGVKEQAEMVQEIATEHGGGGFRWTTNEEERNKLWHARHNAAYSAAALRPGSRFWATDVCVPISRLAECIVETKKELDASFLPAPIVGHVGDGNFHVSFVLDPDKPGDVEEANRLNDNLVARALAMEGTCTGEHGVGYGKVDFLVAEHGDALAVMRTLKNAIDPDGIMNPGKILRL